MNYVLLVEAVLCSSIFVIHSFLAFGIIKARIVDRRQFSKALRDVEFAKKGSSKDEIFKVSSINFGFYFKGKQFVQLQVQATVVDLGLLWGPVFPLGSSTL